MTSRGQKYWTGGSIPLIGPDVLGGIIASASDIGVVISEQGDVLSVLVKPDHKSFGHVEHWEGRNLRDFLTVESVPKLDAKLAAFVESEDGATGSIELNHTDKNLEFPISYSLHRIGPDGALLMLGRDLRPIAEMQQQLVKTQIAIEQDYELQRDFDTRYRVLMDASREAMVFLNVASGRIVDLNKPAAALLGAPRKELLEAAVAQVFDGRRRGEFLEALTNTAIAEGSKTIELIVRKTKARLTVSPSLFRAAGERLLLCRIEHPDDQERVSDQLTEDLSALYQEGVDAIVFTDLNGMIRAANESFLNLADVGHVTNVKGRPLADFLSRGMVDQKVLLENAARAGQMRMYATKLNSAFDNQMSVEISVTHLQDRSHPSFVFVIRDASRVEAVRKPNGTVNDDSVRSVMELVGNATLKDIVAETTDVVEKLCIETAVELTHNNRVAAAEMLGLSRQSLYVKLRKYGLLAKNADS
ncbi:transcriptional regulator PpsR [Nereida sp. MMG025]|uniref:transcriptional regulator PpsR n=1 Tax=Nereida sp. MMG025 TaxID=2909981 RepID=UPI001F028F6F|nr:transcriptional regulator PpsR [Nereida sp. MMG025]MCF6446019.1 transcriptional regulator PpsR [Nereida sp. MMG025]